MTDDRFGGDMLGGVWSRDGIDEVLFDDHHWRMRACDSRRK
ncbi:hypothetical protein [Nocardia sp. CA-120079]